MAERLLQGTNKLSLATPTNTQDIKTPEKAATPELSASGQLGRILAK